MALYVTITILGYISFGSNIADIVLVREPIEDSKDILMSICQASFALNLILATSICIFSNRENLRSFFKNDAQFADIDDSFDIRKEWVILLTVSIIPYLISLLLKEKINMYISLLSCIFCPIFMIIVPAVMNIKLRHILGYSNFKLFLIGLYIFVFSVLFIIAFIGNLFKLFTEDSDNFNL